MTTIAYRDGVLAADSWATYWSEAVSAPWLVAVQAWWPLIWRLALVVAIFAAGWHYGSRSAELELERFKVAQAQATASAVSQLSKDVAERNTQLAKQERASAQTISDLKLEQATRPARIVRLCADAGARAVPGVPGAAGADANHAGGGGEFQSGAGRDIGPGLKRLVDRADVIVSKCLGQQARADQLAAVRPSAITASP